MDLTTIKGIAKARWWILLAAAIVAVVVSGRLTEYRNDHLPEFEAVAAVTFIEDTTAMERDEFENFLDSQYALAQDVNSDVLGGTPGPFIPWMLAEVELATEHNQIVFIGRGYNQEEATELTATMIDRFLSVSPIGVGQERAAEELEELTRQIAELRIEIFNAQQAAPLSDEQLAIESQRAALTNQIAALEARYGELTVEYMNPILRPGEQVLAEMEKVYAELEGKQWQLARLPPPPDQNPAATNEEILLEELRLQQLEARWQALYTEQRELQALASETGVSPQPVTLDAGSTSTNQALSLAGALAAALISLVAIERGRGIMWADTDLEEDGPPVLVELPSRPLGVFHRPTGDPWYFSTPGGRRKAAIQMLRSLLDDHEHSVVALQGTGVFREDVRELTADVAVAVAVSGRSVLLIDTAFHQDNDMVEFGPESGPTLAHLLGGAEDREETMAEFKAVLLSRPEIAHGLRTLRAGDGEWDAADALAGYRFELLMEVARELFDLVFIAGSDLGEAASHILAQRVDSVIVVASAGHTVTRSIEAADREYAIRRAVLLGVAFLRRRRNRLTRWFGDAARSGVWRGIDAFQGWRRRTFTAPDETEDAAPLAKSDGKDR